MNVSHSTSHLPSTPVAALTIPSKAPCDLCSRPYRVEDLIMCQHCQAQTCDACSPACRCPRSEVVKRARLTIYKQIEAYREEIADFKACLKPLTKWEVQRLASLQQAVKRYMPYAGTYA